MNNAFTLIAAAVEPLRAAAVERAKTFTAERISWYKERLEAHDWNLAAVAPRPRANSGRAAYAQAAAAHAFVLSFVEQIPQQRYVPGGPIPVKASPEREQRVIERAGQDASLDFDAYVNKLADKVGDDVVAAGITGCSLWEGSLLTVARADGSTGVWKTQQIINVSSLGKMFNQWPTRKIA